MAKLLIAAIALVACVGQVAGATWGEWYDYTECDCSSDAQNYTDSGYYTVRRDCTDTVDSPCDRAYEDRMMSCSCGVLRSEHILGIAVGGLAFVLIVVLFIVWCCYRCCHRGPPINPMMAGPGGPTLLITRTQMMEPEPNFGPSVITHQTSQPRNLTYIVA